MYQYNYYKLSQQLLLMGPATSTFTSFQGEEL